VENDPEMCFYQNNDLMGQGTLNSVCKGTYWRFTGVVAGRIATLRAGMLTATVLFKPTAFSRYGLKIFSTAAGAMLRPLPH
jgi:hypothetical protein